MELKLGSNDNNTNGEVTYWQRWFHRYARSYAPPIDGYYGYADADSVRILQRNLRTVPVTGVFDELTASACNYKWKDGHYSRPPLGPRKIWFFSAPGSGADWNVGPSHDLGERAKKILKINHQPVGYDKGGYMGLMGGDPKFSYLDVIGFLRNELRRLILVNPNVGDPEFEIWLSGYSQSADGMLEAATELFGDGGEFEHLRPRINGIIVFGNPATRTTGIARKSFPEWVEKLTHNINTKDDFYAVALDRIRPLFYEWFIRAETELPFVVYSGQIIIPALLNLLAPFLSGGLGNPLTTGILAGATGVPTNVLSPILGGIQNSRERPNPELVQLLSVQGVLTNIPELIKLVIALPGLQSHGEYHLPHLEFGGKTGVDVGYDIMADYRR